MAKKGRKGLDDGHRDTTGRINKKLAETGTDSLHAYLRKHHS